MKHIFFALFILTISPPARGSCSQAIGIAQDSIHLWSVFQNLRKQVLAIDTTGKSNSQIMEEMRIILTKVGYIEAHSNRFSLLIETGSAIRTAVFGKIIYKNGEFRIRFRETDRSGEIGRFTSTTLQRVRGMAFIVLGTPQENGRVLTPQLNLKPGQPEIIDANIKILSSAAFSDPMGSESMGGNAGANHLAINAHVDRNGKILRFTNDPLSDAELRQGVVVIPILVQTTNLELKLTTLEGLVSRTAVANFVRALMARSFRKPD